MKTPTGRLHKSNRLSRRFINDYFATNNCSVTRVRYQLTTTGVSLPQQYLDVFVKSGASTRVAKFSGRHIKNEGFVPTELQ